jgi:hypothetical protein
MNLHQLPWLLDALRIFGKQELRDQAAIKKWLVTLGSSIGSSCDWSAEMLFSATTRTLRNESIVAKGVTAHDASSWSSFGDPIHPTNGAIVVFSQGKRSKVGIAVGGSDDEIFALSVDGTGTVAVCCFNRADLSASRWPQTVQRPRIPSLKQMSKDELPRSLKDF